MNTQDNWIWENFIKGDVSALELLMGKYFRFLFNYGTKITRDGELVKDTIQELFIKLWNRRNHLSREVNLKAYLITSLRRALYRKIQLLDRFDNFTDYDNSLLPFEFEISVEQKLITTEDNKFLSLKFARHLALLPKRQKEVLYLKFMEDLTREEIADVMNISLQTVSNMCHIALKNLKVQLEEANQTKKDLHNLIYVLPLLLMLPGIFMV